MVESTRASVVEGGRHDAEKQLSRRCLHRDVRGASEIVRSRFFCFVLMHIKCDFEWGVVSRGDTVTLLVRKSFLTCIHLGIPTQIYIYIVGIH